MPQLPGHQSYIVSNKIIGSLDTRDYLPVRIYGKVGVTRAILVMETGLQSYAKVVSIG